MGANTKPLDQVQRLLHQFNLSAMSLIELADINVQMTKLQVQWSSRSSHVTWMCAQPQTVF